MTGMYCLKPEDFTRICELAPVKCYADIGREYGISKHTVRAIVRQCKHARLKQYAEETFH